MSARDGDPIDVAAEKVYAAFDHLLRLVEGGRLDDLTEAQRRRFSTQLDQLQNRALFMERLVLAELARRRLPAAG